MTHYTIVLCEIEHAEITQLSSELHVIEGAALEWKSYSEGINCDIMIVNSNVKASRIPIISLACKKVLWLCNGQDVDITIPKNVEFIPQKCGKDYFQNKLKLVINEFEQFENIAGQSSTNSILIFDALGVPIWVNKGFEQMYGYKLDEFKTLYPTYFAVSVSPEKEENFQRLLNNEVVEYTSHCHTKSGEKKSLQTNITPVFSSAGKLSKFVVVETDISILMEIEEVLESQIEHTKVLAEHLEEVNRSLEDGQIQIEKQRALLEIEKQRSDDLLHNILPEVVAHKLKKGKVKPKLYKSATIMFADIKGFSKLCRVHNSLEIVEQLDFLIGEFDDIVEKHFVEKIKTIGDAYMCAGGIPMKNNSHHINVVLAALEIQNFLWEFNTPRILNLEQPWDCRIGIHTGEIIAGVVGKKKFAYDIWGDAVNVAARMEQAGVINSVNISVDTYELIKDYFECIPRGFVEAKNIGQVEMFFVTGLKAKYSTDARGVFPNETFSNILRKM
ncbi:MAG: adenylate/guanylate cyclase domain-containing protein [Salinivirgaceae bacterium]|nr:adenylate/guanylate cyclase domain-containing protein [Salinivirgaceae bacterium]MDD4745864.1 adenylate/guanylate cyclase domain-containing protein [Salinivirgaceae bacterium]MDY0278930.1 adenylate/guanylate cyclase domain-containing protein [Salinivirgaceae bacterium]